MKVILGNLTFAWVWLHGFNKKITSLISHGIF